MISKVFSGHSFYHACRYVVNKPEAEVLECIGVGIIHGTFDSGAKYSRIS